MGRSDYTPADALAFHQTLADSLLPVKIAWQQSHAPEHQRQPWEVEQSPSDLLCPLPFHDTADFEAAMSQVFSHLDSEMGGMFERMRDGFLDIDARPGMMPGSEEWPFPVTGDAGCRILRVSMFSSTGCIRTHRKMSQPHSSTLNG